MEKYENLGLVGEGSYGIVMKCKHKATGTLVAIKKFLESEDDRIVRRIANREIKMLRQLRHENLVNLIDVFKRKKKLYLVFEFVDYTLLDDLEKNPHGLEENYAKRILFQVLRGIEFCHKSDVIHRDIKPENILVSKSGIVKLCDFGFARPLSGQSNSFTDYVATRWYRAPELLVGDTKYGRPVDVWAIGCLASEIFAGDPLFPGDSDIDQLFLIIKCIGSLCGKHLELFKKNVLFKGLKIPGGHEQFSLEKRYPKMPKHAINFIKRCLDPTPEDRPSCSELLNFELFNDEYFSSIFINEIKMKVYKEREKNVLLKNVFKSNSSISQYGNNSNDPQYNNMAEKPPIPKNESVQECVPTIYPGKHMESINTLSNQENDILISNKYKIIDDDFILEDLRPLTSKKERVPSRAGRISILKDAFDKKEVGKSLPVDIPQPADKSVDCIKSQEPEMPVADTKTDNILNKTNISPRNVENPSQVDYDRSNIKAPTAVLIPLKTIENPSSNEKSQSNDVSGSSPIFSDSTVIPPSHSFLLPTKKHNVHATSNNPNNTSLMTSKNPVVSYPSTYQQHVTNSPFNYNVLKQMSTNFSQRTLGMPVENTLYSYFPIIGKESKFRSNNFHFPTMGQPNKTFINSGTNSSLKSPSPLGNERSGFYYNGFNKKKPLFNTRPSPASYQDHNINLPELKGAEIPIRSQQHPANTKYKYVTQKPNTVLYETQPSSSTVDYYER